MDSSTSKMRETSENQLAWIVPPKKRKYTREKMPEEVLALSSTLYSPSVLSLQNIGLESPAGDLSLLHQVPKKIARPKIEATLFNKLTCYSPDVKKIVTDWKDLYKTDRKKGFLKIVQLIVNASGRKGTVNLKIMGEKNCDYILRMPMDAQTKRGIFPIMRTSNTWPHFRENYIMFFQTVVESCKESIVHDGFLIHRLDSFINILMECPWWPLRHVAILTALKLTTSLIEVYSEIARQTLESSQPSSGNSVFEIEKNSGFRLWKIRGHFDFVLSVVLPLASREHFYTMRFITISEIHLWIQKYPKYFLDDDYLRYIQISLDDKSYSLKLKGIEVLQNVYEHSENQTVLMNFTQRIETQICKMILHKEPEIVTQIIVLINIIVSKEYDIKFDEYIKIFGKIYNPHPDIARAAGKFLHARITDFLDLNAPRTVVCKKYINSVIEFSLITERQQNIDFLVDSLIESEPYLYNWESYWELLIEGFDPDEDKNFSDDDKELVLIDLMVVCVKQTLTGVFPRGSKAKGKKVFPSNESNNTTLFFLQKLPAIIEKLLPSVDKVSRLLKIPQYFEINEVMASHEEKSIRKLIEIFKNVADAHPESRILNYFIKTVHNLSIINESWEQKCETKLTNMIQICVAKTASLNNIQDQDMSENFVHTLLTLETFFEYRNLNNYSVMDRIFPFIQLCFNESKIEPAAFSHALRCSLFSLTWKIKEQSHLKDVEERNKAILKLHESFEKSADLYESVITRSPIPRARAEAFYAMCEFLKYQSKYKPRISDLKFLGSHKSTYKPHTGALAAMYLFVKSTIFTKDDEETAEVRKRKQNLFTVYCELFELNIIPIEGVIDVLLNYSLVDDEYKYIIKSMMHKIFDNDKLTAFELINTCLLHSFMDFIEKDAEFSQSKDLAKSLATMFPLNRNTRDLFRELHEISISFSFYGWDYSENKNSEAPNVFSPPHNLHFLEISIEFMEKLHKRDKAYILKYLDLHIENDITCLNDCLPFTQYRARLFDCAQTRKRKRRQ